LIVASGFLSGHSPVAFDLGDMAVLCCRITDIIDSEIRADDLSADKIKTEVELALRAPIAHCFMLFLKPFALAEDLQTGTVHDQMDCGAAVEPRPRLQYQAAATAS
jgi:hypothetical protein